MKLKLTDMNVKNFFRAALCIACFGASVAARPAVPPAFNDGETLKYTVSYRAAMWPNTDMGDVTMTVRADTLDGVPTLRIDARATVKGVFSWFYVLDDRYSSWLRRGDRKPVRATADLVEGDYRFASRFDYDWRRGVASNRYRNLRHTEWVDTLVHIGRDAMDGVSLFYNLRGQDIASFEPGEERTLRLLLKDQVKTVRYRYYGRETKKVPGLGRIATLKFSCQLVNDDADSFEEGSEFFVWITADNNKIPVFLESPLRVGRVRARLVEWDGVADRRGVLPGQ